MKNLTYVTLSTKGMVKIEIMREINRLIRDNDIDVDSIINIDWQTEQEESFIFIWYKKLIPAEKQMLF